MTVINPVPRFSHPPPHTLPCSPHLDAVVVRLVRPLLASHLPTLPCLAPPTP